MYATGERTAHRVSNELRPQPRNARTHTKRQIRQIAGSIEAFGFTNPILIDDDKTILAGHGRIEAAKNLGMARAEDGSVRLRQLGAKIDAIRAVLPTPLCWYLHMRNYDLHLAALGLTGLSNSLGTRESDTVRFRVQAQRGLRLPIDPRERDQVEREERLDGVPI